MKKTFNATVAFVMAGVMVISCKKDPTATISPAQKGSYVRIQQGLSAADDTIYLLTYNDKGRLVSIIDSINEDTLIATYNVSGQIVSIADHNNWGGHDNLSVVYNSDGTIKSVSYIIGGERDGYSFEYTGNMPSKAYFSTDAGQGGAPFVWRYYTYTAPGNDITGITEYDKDGQVIGLRTITYSSQSNTFGDLAMFNWANRLGLDNFAFTEMIYNQHVPSKVIWYTGSKLAYTTTLTSANNSQGKPTGLIAKQVYSDNSALIFTWGFGY